ncbi:hypothetical protein BDZ97DRAFT_1851368, partial [Flammula alnicola]
PFLEPKFLGEIIKFAKVDLELESTGITCNGSKVTEKWLDEYGKYLDIMGVSCDSFDDETNLKIGRTKRQRVHTRKVFQVAAGVFQVLLLEGENVAQRPARRNKMIITKTNSNPFKTP